MLFFQKINELLSHEKIQKKLMHILLSERNQERIHGEYSIQDYRESQSHGESEVSAVTSTQREM